MTPIETPGELAARICQAISTKLANDLNALKVIQFETLFHLGNLAWDQENKGVKVEPMTQGEIIWADPEAE